MLLMYTVRADLDYTTFVVSIMTIAFVQIIEILLIDAKFIIPFSLRWKWSQTCHDKRAKEYTNSIL